MGPKGVRTGSKWGPRVQTGLKWIPRDPRRAQGARTQDSGQCLSKMARRCQLEPYQVVLHKRGLLSGLFPYNTLLGPQAAKQVPNGPQGAPNRLQGSKQASNGTHLGLVWDLGVITTLEGSNSHLCTIFLGSWPESRAEASWCSVGAVWDKFHEFGTYL